MEALSQSRSGSRSRRSSRPQTPTHFSLAPLTPRFPLDDYDPSLSAEAEPHVDADDYVSAGARNYTRKSSRNHQNVAISTSYLTSTSVPSTPKLLSRNSSRTRLHILGSVDYASGMTKSKSSAYLRQIDPRLPSSNASIARAKSNLNLTKSKRQDSEWLLRAGLALTTETREAKGQSWLAQRDSSTSLVSQSDEEDDIAIGRGRGSRRIVTKSAGSSPVLSRRGSRTRTSGRGSDFYLTPTQSNALRQTSTMASPVAGMMPDFVDPQPEFAATKINYDPDDLDNALAEIDEDADEEEDDKEEIDEVEREMQRLTRERGFGLGGLVDRVMGWTLFESPDDDPTGRTLGSRLSKTRFDINPAKEPEGQGKVTSGRDNGDTESTKDEKEDVIREAGAPRPGEEGEVGWEDDAKWLIGVAKRLIL